MPVYTIGYAGFTINGFIAELKKYAVNYLIDLRAKPYSEYFTDYDKNYLSYTLKEHNIQYSSLCIEEDAIPDLSLCLAENLSLSGIKEFGLQIQNLQEKGWEIVLMCSEQDPSLCLRSLTFSRHLHEIGLQTFHIAPNLPLYT
ncbi:MAG: DUF488 domain-containing protein, partial [Deferribacteraceae bacterium]|nr:DUF488 domain-containing protein [Deferribacteraceae bacterium]